MSSSLARRWFALVVAILTAGMTAASGQDAPAVVVEEVEKDSPAAKAGLAPSDHVLAYDARPLPSPAALLAAEENTFKPEVTVQVRRGHETLALVASSGRLGLQVRPAMPPAALAAYEEGRTAQRAKQIDHAVARWTAAARTAHEAGDAPAAAWLHGRVGDLYESGRKWQEASAAHRAAWELLKQGDDAASLSRALTALGRCSASTNDFAAAQQWYEQTAEVDRRAGNEGWLAAALLRQGSMAYSRGDSVVAYDLTARALAIRERLAPGSLDVARTLNNLGNISEQRGDLAAAHDFHSRALALFERLAPDSLDVAMSLNNLGLAAWSRNDLTAARDYHLRAIRIKERLAPDSISMAASLNNLAIVASGLGDYSTAQDFNTRALRIREKLVPGSLEVATSLNNLGGVFRARDDLTTAEDYHRRALAIREQIAPSSLEVAMSLNNLGDIARLRDDLPGARDLYMRALAIKEKRAPGSLNVGVTLNSLGLVTSAAGDLAASRDFHERALAIRTRLAPDTLIVAASLNFLGGIALTERRFSDALSLLSRAVTIVEAQRWQVGVAESRALLMQNYTAAYIGVMRAQVALGDVPAAFASAERVRARSLLDSLAESATRIRREADPALLARERQLQEEINTKANRQLRVLARAHTDEQAAAAKEDLDASLVQYREAQAQIRKAEPRYAALAQPQPIGLADVQRDLLDDNTVLLEYVLGADGSYLFALTSTTSRVVEIPKRAEIEAAARRVYELMSARQTVAGETATARKARIDAADAAFPAAASALSGMILGPVADQLSGRRLLIVADGALQYVPFAALPDPAYQARESAGGDRGAGAGQPLIVDHEIVSLPSASVLALLRGQSRGRSTSDRLVAVVADPVFDTGDPRLRRSTAARANQPATGLPADVAAAMRSAGVADDRGTIARLPFTRDEARAIFTLAPAGQATQAIDFKANRATVTSPELGRYRVVHLATHGLLDTEHPELSGLVLSLVDERGQPQDGFLRLHEIFNLDWSAELVVLSACQTGLGKEIRGEGLVGLTRGFMYAGAERVIASLWNVNDNATAQIMRRFYEGLFARRLSAAAALRAAQVEMWKQRQWRAPYFWAAFVLQGEWR